MQTPNEEREEITKKTVVFIYTKLKNGQIMNPSPDNILPTFYKWMDDVKYCTLRITRFETLEFRFKDEETIYAIAISTIETYKWIFYPIYMWKRIVQIGIGDVPHEIKAEWLVAAVLANSEDTYNNVDRSPNRNPELVGFRYQGLYSDVVSRNEWSPRQTYLV